MKGLVRSLVLSLLFVGIVCLDVFAGGHPELEKVLTQWDGPKEVVLRSDLADPLASPLIQELVELLLARDMPVVPGPLDAPAGKGLTLDLRSNPGGGQLLMVRRASDGAILAMERSGPLPEPVPLPKVKPAEPQVVPVPAVPSSPVVAPRSSSARTLQLSNAPVGLLVLSNGKTSGVDLLLLDNGGVESCRLDLQHFGLQKTTTLAPPQSSFRPLYLEGGDLPGDGKNEVVVAWAEDVKNLYVGTDSRIHSRLFSATATGLQPLSDELNGYVRIIDNQALWQERGKFSLVSGPVFPVTLAGDRFVVSKTSQSWPQAGIFAGIPLAGKQFLAWKENNSGLQVISAENGSTDAAFVLFENFGAFRGTEVAIPLETPEYRSGFSREDAVTEVHQSLPRRMLKGADGAVYTIWRGRQPGLPLVGSPSGQDSVVRIVERSDGLQLDRPFPGVEGFILDFALLPGEDGSLQALLLVNEKENGSGPAFLHLISSY